MNSSQARHYAEAERLLGVAVHPGSMRVMAEASTALALVHATLATVGTSEPAGVPLEPAAPVMDDEVRELLAAADSVCSLILHREVGELSRQTRADLADLVIRLRKATS